MAPISKGRQKKIMWLPCGNRQNKRDQYVGINNKENKEDE